MNAILYYTVVLIILVSNTVSAQRPTVINVHVDYMADASHSHRPAQAEIDAVVRMFACQGITLNVVIGNQVQHFDVIRRDTANNKNIFGFNDGLDTFGGIKAGSFDKGAGWHYALFAHQYQDTSYNTTTSSGLGQQPGSNFMVTLGAFENQIGTPWDRAATFAHELGHNLGLSHSGSMDEDTSGSYTPNLPSIMSYFYQLRGIRNNMECQGLIPPGQTLYKNLDYSHGRACTVNENELDEQFGIGITPVDWDCNGTISGVVAQDLSNQSNHNGWCDADGALTILSDYDEWSNIRDPFVIAKEIPTKEVSCITHEEYEEYMKITAQPAATCPQPAVTIESCTNNQMFYVRSGGQGFVEGSCSRPFNIFGAAYQAARNGDIIYLLPGNHVTGPLTISKQLLIGGPGGAVLGQ